MASIDLIIIAVYLIACLIIGLYKVDKINNIREYSLGKSSFPTVILVATIFSTYISARASIADIGLVYSSGLIYGIPLLLSFILWFIQAKVFIKNIYRFKDCITISDIMYKLYGKVGLIICNISAILVTIGILAMQAIALALIFEEFFPFSYKYKYELGIILGFTILTLYSLFGGIKAVALTDFFQFLTFFIAFPVACGFLYNEVTAERDILVQLSETDIFSLPDSNGIWLLISYFLYFILPTTFPPYVQRLLMGKNIKQLNTTFTLVAVLTLIFSAIIVMIALMIKIKHPNLLENNVFYYFINHYIPIGLKGLMISAIIAIIMSTSDSWLNACSTIVAHDILKKIYPKIDDKTEVTIAKAATLLISIISMLIAFSRINISDLLFYTLHFWFPIVNIPLVAGFLGIKITIRTFITSIITGIIFCFFGRYVVDKFGIISLLSGMIGSIIPFFFMYYSKLKTVVYQYFNSASTFLKSKTFAYLIFYQDKSKIKISNSCVSLYSFIYLIKCILGFIFLNKFCNNWLLLDVMGVLLFLLLFSRYYFPNVKNKFYQLIIDLFITYTLIFIPSVKLIVSSYNYLFSINLILSSIIYILIMRFDKATIAKLSIIFFSSYLISKVFDNEIIETISYMVTGSYDLFFTLIFMLIFIYLEKKKEGIKLETIRYYTGVIAHEISPLMRQIQRVLGEEKIEGKEKENILRISNEVLEVTDTILKNVKKPEFNNNHSFNVGELIKGIIKEYPFESYEKGIVQLKIKDNYELVGDRKHFQQAIINILRNALQYVDELKNKNEVIISVYKAEEEKIIEIYDNGYGIKRGDIARLYKPLFTTRKTGTGLGLYYCYNTIVNMGGTIECDSEENKYTKFFIRF